MNEQDGDLILEVKDNGKGITESKFSGTGALGILGMRERALLFGGEVNIGPAPEKGTIVTVRIPLQVKRPRSSGELYRTQGVM